MTSEVNGLVGIGIREQGLGKSVASWFKVVMRRKKDEGCGTIQRGI
jgi:hypothetical protein